MGQWQEAGLREPPSPESKDESSVEDMAVGHGPIVRAGDLVQIKVRVAVAPSHYQARSITNERREPAILWLWTGKEPDLREHSSLSAWGDLGSPRVRKALVGRAVGARILFAPDKKWIEAVPLKGFAVQDAYKLIDNGTLEKPKLWRHVELADRRAWLDPEARGLEIEILQTCEGRLLRRTALMRQSGTIFNIFEMSYRSKREGTLRWSALEGTCASPVSKVRFEIGPLYYYRGRADHDLYNWEDSYRRMRPPAKYPHEYMICSQQGGPIRCTDE